MFTKLAVGTLMGLAALAMGLPGGRAFAQYPVPNGSCVLSTSATSTNPNGSVGVTVTVRDVNGHPVAGTNTNLSITNQPGGASLSGVGSSTDASGTVKGTLNAGTTGLINLAAHAANVDCSGSVVVGESAVLAEVALPDTGDGASAGGGSPSVFAAFVLGALGVVTLAWAASRRSRRA